MWTIAVVTTACLVLLGVQFRRLAYGLLDPIVVGSIGLPLSGALVASLAVAGLIPFDVICVFSISALGFVIGSFALARAGQATELVNQLQEAVGSQSTRHCLIVVLTAVSITVLLGAFAIKAGAGGDARQEFNRLFRPLVLVQSGLFYLSLVVLLHRGFSRPMHALMLLLLTVPTLPFSGKSFALPLAFHLGLYLYTGRRSLSLTWLLVIAGGSILGYLLVSFLSYGAGDLTASIELLITRLWMSGDVYIYAYQKGGLDNIRPMLHASFVEYVLHPLTSVFGYRAYEVPLGAMLASDAVGYDVFTGPNTQLPVLLNLYFGNNYFAILGLSAFFGWLCYLPRRLCLIYLLKAGGWPRIGLLTAAVFLPAYGFFDLSLVTINVIAIAAGASAAMLSIIAVEMLAAGLGPSPIARR